MHEPTLFLSAARRTHIHDVAPVLRGIVPAKALMNHLLHVLLSLLNFRRLYPVLVSLVFTLQTYL